MNKKPRPVNRRQRCLNYLHDTWQHLRGIAAVLALIRFSLLIPALLAVTLMASDQMTDILRAVGEDGRHAPVGWLLAMAAFAGLIVWYAARSMLRFHFVPTLSLNNVPRWPQSILLEIRLKWPQD